MGKDSKRQEIGQRIRKAFMGKLFLLMGKSASGKDSIYDHLLNVSELGLEKLVLYTTRPKRAGELDGREYHFVNEETFLSFRESGRLIEDRAYETVQGLWRYFTADDGKIDLQCHNYIAIGTLESYEKIREYFGKDQVLPLYLEVEDGERLSRALLREKEQKNPNYEELCRRFLADCRDFCEEKIAESEITVRFQNQDRTTCLEAIESYIRSVLY